MYRLNDIMQQTYNVEVLDGDGEVWVFLEAWNGRRAENMASTFNVNAWSVDAHELDAF